ncbi:CoA ester lyase [Rhizobium sp. SSA_523]|uniref:HpcH/HpaI aldolase/citrate lyase family protein n=1 Tax=Rhizobium sp. SSA_523 TaxID=2952477 RepID=UPI002090AD17|nr:CoA ester lyase [Rhizobium sp. SSA_523]MCO5734582.1 CoA ester lyase [Rhizobium sp. SSA_523]WKC23360.1 CoA ester lyase [Rhizobium sp. SSA_523]
MVISPASSLRPRRSLLTVPAINLRALEKCRLLDCDGVIFDLEDSVAVDQKPEARLNLERLFAEARLTNKETIIRINGLDSPFLTDDLALVEKLSPDAVLVPKVERPDDLVRVQQALDAGTAATGPRLWAMMETARGVLNVAAIAESRPAADRLDVFVIGLNDLRKETRVMPRPGRVYLVPYLMQVILAARANGLDVIDSVFNDFRDKDGFAEECRQGREMGFDGKMLIHPAQIDPANQAFGPLPEALADAAAIVSAFARPESAGQNVINLNGRMVERLHLEEAERLLSLAKSLKDRKTDT